MFLILQIYCILFCFPRNLPNWLQTYYWLQITCLARNLCVVSTSFRSSPNWLDYAPRNFLSSGCGRLSQQLNAFTDSGFSLMKCFHNYWALLTKLFFPDCSNQPFPWCVIYLLCYWGEIRIKSFKMCLFSVSPWCTNNSHKFISCVRCSKSSYRYKYVSRW